MLAKLKQQYANLLTSGAHLALLVIGFQIDTPQGWIGVLGLISFIGFFAWTGNFRRSRIIGDTPTSRVASAAQGYVELYGRAEQHHGRTFLSRLTALPCVWFRYSIERKEGDKWVHEERGCSDETFLLKDDTGECVVDPDHAEIINGRKEETWTKGNYRYTESLLLPKDRLYAIGEFATIGGANVMLNVNGDLSALLAEWKRDKPKLHERFDLNQDGQIELKEWELARLAAKREVEKKHREIRQEGNTVHVMRKPGDGRLFLLSNLEPKKLSRKYTLWGWFHISVFFLACGAALLFAFGYDPSVFLGRKY